MLVLVKMKHIFIFQLHSQQQKCIIMSKKNNNKLEIRKLKKKIVMVDSKRNSILFRSMQLGVLIRFCDMDDPNDDVLRRFNDSRNGNQRSTDSIPFTFCSCFISFVFPFHGYPNKYNQSIKGFPFRCIFHWRS